MKDLTFLSESGVVNVRFRTDLVHASAKNFSILNVYGLEDLTADNPAWDRHRKLAKEFTQVLAKQFITIPECVAFAEINGLRLTIADTDGSNSSVLVDYIDSDSES